MYVPGWGTYYVPHTYNLVSARMHLVSRLPRYVYVDTCEPGLHPPPKKEQNAQHTYQHVCTWYQPARKIRICRYLCTRATSQTKKGRRPIDEIAPKKQNKINRNTELCHHRPRRKAHSNEYENNANKTGQSLPVWRGAGRSSRGTKPLLSSSDGARSCRIRLPRDLWTSW